MNPYIKESLIELKPYTPIEREKGIFLDANENPFGPHNKLKEHMATWISEMPINRYPDSETLKLKKVIANQYGVLQNQIICGVGSDQLIDCLLRSVIEKGDVVIGPEPSFSMYALSTKLNGGVFEGVPLEDDFSYKVQSFLEKIKEKKPKVVFLCNPNNPTGTIMSKEAILSIVEQAPGIVVVDEAYIEFGGESVMDKVHQYTNLLVLRTFSKAYGLAGARIGYGIGSTQIIEAMSISKPPYHLNMFSQEIGCWVLEHIELFQPLIQMLLEEREKLYTELKEKGYQVYRSQANFLWVQTLQDLDRLCLEKSIYIKKFLYKKTQYYRITVGSSKENIAFLKHLPEERSN